VTKVEWADFCEDVTSYFGALKLVGDKRVDLWYDECHFIPIEALEWIKRKIFDEHDSLPRNLPKALKGLWYAWKDANPERLVHENVQCDAPGCTNGFINVYLPRKHEYEHPYTGIAWCDQCAPQRRLCKDDDPNLSNLRSLEARGCRLKVPVLEQMDGKRPARVSGLTKGIGG
jgi:hypothetical protein